MKKLFLILSLAAATIYFFSSCERESSSDVNQDRIYVLYEIIYDQPTDLSYAKASFFFGSITGTKLELADPNNIKCNDINLGFKNALAYYEAQYTGNIETGNFVWTDTDGNVFNNTATIKSVAFPETPDTIIKGQSYELSWVGDPLGAEEIVWIFVDGQMENDEINVYQTTPGATKAFFTAIQTNKLSVGTNTMVMHRRNNTEPQEATSAGAKCAGVYQTITVDIEVKE